jgi:hypothetical protein
MLLKSLDQYYRLNLRFGSGGSAFDVPVLIATADSYTGTGSEFSGVLDAQGPSTLRAIAQALGNAMSEAGGSSWGAATVVSIQAQPISPTTLGT